MNTFSLQTLQAKLARRVERRAIDLQRTALRLHREAPRGGENINAFGQHRSAPGEQPAPEYGTLTSLIASGTDPSGHLQWDVTANYKVLEHGTRHVAARPLGAMTVETVKTEIATGGSLS